MIIVRQTNCIIKIGESKDYKKFEEVPVLIDTKKLTFSHGGVGLFSNGNDKFFTDNFQISPHTCYKTWETIKSVKVVPDSSNFYTENYESFTEKYFVEDPERAKNGPSKWKFADKIYGRDKVLIQSKDISDAGQFNERSIALLKNTYIKKKGIINLK